MSTNDQRTLISIIIGAAIIHLAYLWSSDLGEILGWLCVVIWALVFISGIVPKNDNEK